MVKQIHFPRWIHPWIRRITHSIVDNNLQIKDIDFLRKHYQKTLEIWFNNFSEHREQIEEMLMISLLVCGVYIYKLVLLHLNQEILML